MDLRFEWDREKAARNAAKHGVTFGEASTVFHDPIAAILPDELHSADETREIIIGHAATGRVLLVSFTERAGTLRIISARQASRKDRKDYEEHTSS